MTCKKCGGPMPRNSGRGRPRVNCDKCRPTRSKQPLAVIVPVDTSGRMADLTRAQLDDAGRLDTPRGGAAMTLAERIDSGQDAGSSLAALVKQYHATLDLALEGVSVVASPVDELRARRAAKHA